MSAIGQALATKLERINERARTPAGNLALGATVAAQVAGIVAECKLAPAEGANPHLNVAEMSAGNAHDRACRSSRGDEARR